MGLAGVEPATSRLSGVRSNHLSYKPIRQTAPPARCPARHQSIDRLLTSPQAGFIQEVIQPHLPVRLPCYDLAPVTRLTLGSCLPKVSTPTSGTPDFHRLTGGVYKARERIHRVVADTRLLAIPPSWSRVADSNPNWEWLSRSAARRRVASLCTIHCSTCAAPDIRAMMT